MPIAFRTRIITMITAATPEYSAPTTKNGPKIALCQPGWTDIERFHDTPVCTENITGIITNDRMLLTISSRCHSPPVPRQPNASAPYSFLRQPVV